MDELKKLKEEHGDDERFEFNEDKRLKELISQYVVPRHEESISDTSDSEEEKIEHENDYAESSKEDEEESRSISPVSFGGKSTSFKGNYQKIGEKLQNYDFHDQRTERLFGYNLPDKFFFKEDRGRVISHRKQTSIAYNETEKDFHETLSGYNSNASVSEVSRFHTERKTYACSGTSTNDFQTYSNENTEKGCSTDNMTKRFTSTGTSSMDSGMKFGNYQKQTNKRVLRTINDEKLPTGLFQNSPELANHMNYNDSKDDNDEYYDSNEF